MRKTKFDKAVDEIYTEWYANARPKASFEELSNSAFWINETNDKFVCWCDETPSLDFNNGCRKRIIYEAYFIDDSKCHEIVDNIKKKYKLSHKSGIDWIYLGAGPSYKPEYDEIEEEKFNKLIDMVDNGEEIKFEHLPEYKWEKEKRISLNEERKMGKKDALLLYEYNRKLYPEIAKEYLHKCYDNVLFQQ